MATEYGILKIKERTVKPAKNARKKQESMMLTLREWSGSGDLSAKNSGQAVRMWRGSGSLRECVLGRTPNHFRTRMNAENADF
jgi:hypothetical protein